MPMSEKSIVPLLTDEKKSSGPCWGAAGAPTVADVTGGVICPFGSGVTGSGLEVVLTGGVMVGWVAIG